MEIGYGNIKALDSRCVLASIALTYVERLPYCDSPTPSNDTPPALGIRQTLVPLMASGFSSDAVCNSLHLPAPSYAALRESFPDLCSPDDHPSEPSPVDPYDLSLWQPSSDISVAPRARDSEFERFLLDDMTRIRCQDPNAYPSLLLRIKYDTNRAVSCLDAWHRANSINVRQHFYPKPLSKVTLFRNNLAILRSNSKYARCDVTGALADIFDLDAPVPCTDLAVIRAGNNVVAALGETILAVESLIGRLDIVITRSRNRYASLVEESDCVSELEEAAVVSSDDEEEYGDDNDVDVKVESVEEVSQVQFPSLPLVPDEYGVIYITD